MCVVYLACQNYWTFLFSKSFSVSFLPYITVICTTVLLWKNYFCLFNKHSINLNNAVVSILPEEIGEYLYIAQICYVTLDCREWLVGLSTRGAHADWRCFGKHSPFYCWSHVSQFTLLWGDQPGAICSWTQLWEIFFLEAVKSGYCSPFDNWLWMKTGQY